MIGAEREIRVACSQADTWQFVQDIGNWAAQMPGYHSHQEVDADASVWTLNVDMGAFSRAVVVEVNVQRWAPPAEVDFTMKGRFEPFHGRGSFRSRPCNGGTAIALRLETEVTGSMSKVLTAMATPVLNRVADQFAANLQGALGGAATVPASPVPTAAEMPHDAASGPAAGGLLACARRLLEAWRRRAV
ncbi:CoxG family protein [Ramlibacter algicola]|uniref:SRPBCC family protein n=1 Tax=Ramlibacter algicola TaxID=2795217 RepID=A0A934Q0N8_9BURK|nr:SRPBCC family protein [Ramlibacter algicola]MBK0392127.1 SRPBCC family protein [Ramlibacter algicola]